MFMFLAIYVSSPPTVDSVPSGWTLVATNTTTNSRWYLYYKIASGEGTSYTWSLTASARYYALNIAYSSGDFDVQSISDITAISNTLYGTGNANVRAASMNVPAVNSPLVYFGAIYNTTVRTFTKPILPTTDWVEDADQGHTIPDLSLTIGSMIWTGSGATGDMDITCSASITTYKHAFAVALKPVVAPTVSTQAATLKEATTATCNGTITVTGGVNSTNAGCEWDIDTGAPYANTASTAGDYGAAPFTQSLTSLPSGTTIYARAFATNSAGTGYGGEVSFLTKPAAPTSVAATDGSATDKVTITWTKSTGATDYHVWRDSTDLGAAGDVATFDDTGADAPIITPGTAAASDGTSADYVALSVSGQSANNGTTHTYKVVASNATGNSADSATDTGYRGVGSLTYQWQRSAADSDASYSNIDGATTASYNDTGAPSDGSGRYYKVVENATGATQQISASDRGYRLTTTISCSTDNSSTSFSAWTDTSIKTSSPNASTTMSCSGTSSGCALYVKNAGGGGNPGLWKSAAPTYLIASVDAVLSAGVDGYGIQATSTASGSGGTLSFNSKYNQTGNNVGGLTLTNTVLASSTVDVSGREAVVIHKAAVSGVAISGSYSDTITYECTAN